jgi:hypothetical protein
MFRQTTFYRNLSNELVLIYEIIMGIVRLLFLVLSCLIFAVICAKQLEGADVWSIAEQIRNMARPEFARLPIVFWVLFVPFQNWQYFRYLFAPLGAFLLIFSSTVFYVRDIYHLPTLGRAFHYVMASLFAIFFPVARIDGSKINDEDPDDENELEEKNLLRAIGGPGFAVIQPGNAVAVRDWHRTLGIEHNRLYFMRPFEMIARVVSLEDQQGHINESPAITRDGIRLRLKNIDYRFCALRPARATQSKGQHTKRNQNHSVPRTPASPYPFATDAIDSIAYSFSVSDKGMDRWHEAVRRAVDGAVVNFVSSHDLDYLTAPRQDGQNPRRELRVELFAPAVSSDLRRWGAELHWMDIGQFEIDPLEENKELDPVDQTRTQFWAARWIGDANTIRSYGEAKHLAYQELARAEAQAEMIMSITDALRNVSLGQDRAETLRQIFLARTAQILEALRDNGSAYKKE